MTRLATRLAHAPIALVTMIDEDGQYFLSCVGLPEPLSEKPQTSLSASFCKGLVETGDPLMVSDLAMDPALAKDATLRELGIASYAGIPLRTATGQLLGSFCVLDRVPREWTEQQMEMLTTLANSATSEIELRSSLDRQAELTMQIASSRSEARAAVLAQRENGELLSAVIAERTAALEQLRASEERLRALVDASPLAIIVSDFDDVIHFWSVAAERMFGWSVAEVLGQPARHVPDDAQAELQTIRETTQKGIAITGLVTQRVRRDGARIDVAQSTAPLRDASGRPNFVMSIIADTTDQRQLEEQLRQSQKMEAVGRLAGGIAHDFNNLLTVIRVNADFIIEDLTADDARRDEVDEIRKAADRAASLTRQLLVFSRRQVVQPKTVQLNEIVGNMKQMVGRLIGEDIVLASVLEPDLGTVHADVGQLEQVLLNLVVNARDAMPLGGAIVVATCGARLGPEALGWQMPVQPGDYVQLTVSDTGAGMTPDVQAHIFEPFFTTKEPGKGTGLGLSTVYGIVQQMNGSIVVRSEPRNGTIFTIYLPVVKAGAPVAQPAEDRTEQRPGTETILLVEDEDAVRRLARRALEMSGYRILEASHGGEALRVCGEHGGAIDLLLTDVVMPLMSGAELAEQLKPLRPDMRVLFMSGYTEDALGNHGVLAPETAFLYKPFTPDLLRRTVREVLNAVRPASSDTAEIDITDGRR